MTQPERKRQPVEEEARSDAEERPGREERAEDRPATTRDDRAAVREERDDRPAAREDRPVATRDDRDAAQRRTRAEKGEHAAFVGLRVVDWAFYTLYALLGLRFLLALLAANEEAGFTQLVYGITAPFLVPFEGIVARPALDGSVVDFPVLLAIVAYIVLHLAVRGLIRTIGTASAPPRRE